MALERARLQAVRDLDAAVALMAELGYRSSAQAVNADELGIGDYPRNRVLKLGRNRREGYGVFIAEVPALPRSLASLGKRLLLTLHDHPLAILGVPGPSGHWDRFVVLRPKRAVLEGRGAGATNYRVAKLEVIVSAPSRHDGEVLERIRWNAQAENPQAEVDRAFDIEAVTREFFAGLRRHADRLESEIKALAARSVAVARGVEEARGARRLTIRIISQLIFCWFLQRKGLLAGDRDYLGHRWTLKNGSYFTSVLEPLFYDILNTPPERRPAGREAPNIPFLNGGLFERTYGDAPLALDDALFEPTDGLLGYLGRWTFTISEEAPDELDVAIDPELLGRIFEHLITDDEQSRHGVVYTPRPVVQFMVREALVGWMTTTLGLSEGDARTLLVEDDALERRVAEHGTRATLDLCRTLEEALDRLRVLDPAVGSGAFLLGTLSEIVRLKTMIHRQLHAAEPDAETLRGWKLHAIQSCLFGVDIEPQALELCHLRFWLALLVDMDPGHVVPLPNLEYRTVAADSLTDFVGGVAVQDTRSRHDGAQVYGLELPDLSEVVRLRREYFTVTAPREKTEMKERIRAREDAVMDRLFAQAEENLLAQPGMRAHADAQVFVRELRARFRSRDRVYPIFMPEFHAPEAAAAGWDIVIMNPPYLGKKEVARKVPRARRADYVHHFGESNDLMVHFGHRAMQFVRPGGICSMIFNDSIFTSTDAMDLRVSLCDGATLLAMARTRCFEGMAVNGGVIVWRAYAPEPGHLARWVENYKRDPRDLGGASGLASRSPEKVNGTEVWHVDQSAYQVIPHRPLFRPSPAALRLLPTFRAMLPDRDQAQWWKELAERPRVTAVLRKELGERNPGAVVPLGFVMDGGQGLATADDRYFLAAREGTDEAEDCLRRRAELVARIEADPAVAPIWHDLRSGKSEEEALLALHEEYEQEVRHLRWPRLVRVAPAAHIRSGPLTDDERSNGITAGPFFVPFEKGDASGEDESGRAVGARWWRDNPIVIDWSREAVSLLRTRARQAGGHRKPYFRNEHLWGRGGVTWNEIARYLRAREVPDGVIFGHKAATVSPLVVWLDHEALLALLNADVTEFLVRTFLGSLMQIEVGDIRHIPIPVLSAAYRDRLSELGRDAILATQAGERARLREIETEINRLVRGLYGIPEEAELWVVR